jgi:AcrR family transcriptional regulator
MSKPKTRSEKQAETRAALLRAASELFPKGGMEGTSVDDIAAAAGYTKGAFYSNFRSKEELFLVMLDERFAENIERLDRALAGGEDADEEAQQASTDFLTQIHADPDWPRLYFEFVAYAARNEAFREEFAMRHRELRRRMAGALVPHNQGAR